MTGRDEVDRSEPDGQPKFSENPLDRVCGQVAGPGGVPGLRPSLSSLNTLAEKINDCAQGQPPWTGSSERSTPTASQWGRGTS